MIPKTLKHKQKLFLWSGVVGTFLLLTIGTLILWHNNRPPLEPVKIYKAVPVGEMNTDRSTPQRTKMDTQSLPNAEKRPGKEHMHDGHTHAHGVVTTSERPNYTAPENVGTPETEALPHEELEALAHQSWHAKWEKDMAALSADLDEKYPDLVKLTSLSLEEIQARYSTKSDLDVLGERIEAMRSEFQTRLNTLVKEIPADHQVEFIIMVGDMASANWSREIADEIISDFLINIGQ